MLMNRWLSGAGNRVIGAVDIDTRKIVLQIDQDLQRAVEVPCLLGDSTFAKKTIRWQPVSPFQVRLFMKSLQSVTFLI